MWNVLTGVHAGVLKMPTDDFVTALAFVRIFRALYMHVDLTDAMVDARRHSAGVRQS